MSIFLRVCFLVIEVPSPISKWRPLTSEESIFWLTSKPVPLDCFSGICSGDILSCCTVYEMLNMTVGDLELSVVVSDEVTSSSMWFLDRGETLYLRRGIDAKFERSPDSADVRFQYQKPWCQSTRHGVAGQFFLGLWGSAIAIAISLFSSTYHVSAQPRVLPKIHGCHCHAEFHLVCVWGWNEMRREKKKITSRRSVSIWLVSILSPIRPDAV